jgi:hypothetical protein
MDILILQANCNMLMLFFSNFNNSLALSLNFLVEVEPIEWLFVLLAQHFCGK